MNKDDANNARLAKEEQKSLITYIHLLTKELETHRDSSQQKVLTAVFTDASAQAKSAYSSSATTTTSRTTTDRQREAGTDHREQSSHHTASPASSPQDPNHPERNAGPPNSNYNKPIVIIGDSIIKNIDPRGLSKKPVPRKFTYPGKTADQIFEEVTSVNVSGDPAHVIVYAGTNNLPTDSAQRCAEKIVDLAKSVKLKFPNSRIAVSALTQRRFRFKCKIA